MKAVVLADDGAARLQPLTRTRPTAMLPVAGAPILEYVLDAAADFVDGFVIVVGHRPAAVREYFGEDHDDLEIAYVSVSDRSGPAHAIARVAPHLDGPALVVHGDRLVPEPVLRRLATGRPPAVAVEPGENPTSDGSNLTTTDYPATSPNGSMTPDTPNRSGEPIETPIAYLLSPPVIDSIESDTPRPERDVDLRTIVEGRQPAGSAIRVVHADENHTHITYPWHLLEATADILAETNSAIDGRVGHTVSLLGKAQVETGARIRNGTYIQGPVHILTGADVGPNAFLKGPAIVGPNVSIGNAVELEHSICMDNVTVGHQSTIRHSILGAGASIGANTTVEDRPRVGETVTMSIGDEMVDTERERLGVVIADNAETAIGTNLGAGVVLGPDETTTPGETIRTDPE